MAFVERVGAANAWKKTPEIIALIETLMEHETAGDPINGLKWTRKTTQKLSTELRALGIANVNRTTVARLLKGISIEFEISF